MKRKPKGFGKFRELLGKLAAVPKEDVDARMAEAKAAKKERRNK